MKSDLTLSVLVDSLGAALAEKADANDKAEALKAELIFVASSGPESVFDGRRFRASVSFVDKKCVDWDGVAAELEKNFGISKAEFVATKMSNTKVAAGVPVVRVSGRKS